MIAIKQTWPEDEILVYLCSFHVLKNRKNHIWINIHNLNTLKDLINRQLHYFIYLPNEYNENEEFFWNVLALLRKICSSSYTWTKWDNSLKCTINIKVSFHCYRLSFLIWSHIYLFVWICIFFHSIIIFIKYTFIEMNKWLLWFIYKSIIKYDTFLFVLYKYISCGPPSESIFKPRHLNKYWVLSCNSKMMNEDWQPPTPRSEIGFFSMTFTTYVVTHYIYNHGRKLNDFVFNKLDEEDCG